MIYKADRATFYGETGTGKSELARRAWIGFDSPRGVLDVKDDLADALPGIPTIESPSEVMLYPTWRAVPPMDDGAEAWFDELYRVALAQGDTLIWLDEANEVSTPNKIPTAIRRFVLQGRSRNCGHFACTTRPADINPTFASQSQHLFIFDVRHPLDRDAIGRLVGVQRDDLAAQLDALPPFGYLHYDKRTRELSAHSPSHHPDELTARIGSLYFGPYVAEDVPQVDII